MSTVSAENDNPYCRLSRSNNSPPINPTYPYRLQAAIKFNFRRSETRKRNPQQLTHRARAREPQLATGGLGKGVRGVLKVLPLVLHE